MGRRRSFKYDSIQKRLLVDEVVVAQTTANTAVVSANLSANAQSSITSVGTLTGLSVSSDILPNADNTVNIGHSVNRFATVYGVTFSGTSTTAKYADLAELYFSDENYQPGTVVKFGGSKEITITSTSHDVAVAGVISTNPAYLMNNSAEGIPVALQGRVPCQVKGPINKGDRVVSSDIPGVAERLDPAKYQPGCVIGKSLGTIDNDNVYTIEVVVGRV